MGPDDKIPSMLRAFKQPWGGDRPLDVPDQAAPAGYAWLVSQYGLSVMPNYRWSFLGRVGGRQSIQEQGITWETFPLDYQPENLPGHIAFALKYDGINLEILRACFEELPEDDRSLIAAWVRGRPTGTWPRRCWYLYELLSGRRLEVPDAVQGNYLPLLDPLVYFSGPPRRSPRHRVLDNLLGDRDFSPLVRRTAELEAFGRRGLSAQITATLEGYSPDILQRAVSWLYTKETRSSFEIEREQPSTDRLRRFIAVLQQAPRWPALSPEELVRLQNLIVTDRRFQDVGYREIQNYVGGPGPRDVHFVSPRPEDLPALMDGWLGLVRRLEESEGDAVVAAAVVAFAFVFLHPFDDGNGRIHRFLIHYLLARKGFTPKDMIVPVSATILARPAEYDAALERFSRPLLERTVYEMGSDGTLEVLNKTIGFFRYFDATAMTEALYGWLSETIEKELPKEMAFVALYREVRQRLVEVVDLPDRLAEPLVARCLENGGTLSNHRRKTTFPMLTDAEVEGVARLIEAVKGAHAAGLKGFL